MIEAVLFDFDGTLADTAPDLGHALNRQRIARGLPELPIAQIRHQASAGSRGLLGLGFNIKPGDLVVNVTEGKKLTNHRASGSDDATRIAPTTLMSLEECMEYIQHDECIEVTPNFIRMRKIHLDENERIRQAKSMKVEEV